MARHEVPSRREFGAIAAGTAVAGVTAALAVEAVTGAFGKYVPDKSLDALYNPTAPIPEHMKFLQGIRQDAMTIAQNHVVIPNLPVQGLLPEEYQPIVNATAIVEAMLLMTQDAFGQAGRERLTTQLQKRGLNITVGQFSAPEKKGTADTRYQLPLPGTMVGAHLTYEGQNASENVDDFPVLTAANNLVTAIINEGIAPDNLSVSAQLANVGVGLAGGAIIAGAAEPMPSRLGFMATAVAGTAGAWLAAESFKWGQGTVHAANTGLIGGKSIGSSYDKMGDFSKLAQTPLFTTDIKGKMIVQQRVK